MIIDIRKSLQLIIEASNEFKSLNSEMQIRIVLVCNTVVESEELFSDYKNIAIQYIKHGGNNTIPILAKYMNDLLSDIDAF